MRYFQITTEDVGRLGITKRDIGKWGVLVCGVIHLKKTEAQARELCEYLRK